MRAAPPVPIAEVTPYPRRWTALAVLCLSLVVIGLDNTVLNVALPTLQRDLDATASELQWIVDAYMLVFAGCLLTAGALGDAFGRKRALTAGLVVFGLGSGLSVLAETPGWLIATRALMGIGGALIMPSTLSILTAMFPAGERAKAIGIWAGMSGIGIALGPVIGGWLLEHHSWGSIFLLNLPVVALALVGGRGIVPESRDPRPRGIDLGGFALSIAGLTTLVWAIIEAPGRGWTDTAVMAGFALAAVLLAGLAWWERRAAQPMLDVTLFRDPRFSAASAVIALAFFAMLGTIFFLTQYLQAVLGHSALEAGLRTAPLALGVVIAAPLSARVLAATGLRAVVTGGMLILAAGLVVLAQADAGAGLVHVVGAELIVGFGIGMTTAPATDSIMGSLPLGQASAGSAVNDTTRVAGGALGVAVLGSVLSAGYRGEMETATAGLPTPAAEAASDSLLGALAVAERAGGAVGAQLGDAAVAAFVSGMHTAVLVGAAIVLLGSLVAMAFLPGRPAAAAPPAEAALAPEPARVLA